MIHRDPLLVKVLRFLDSGKVGRSGLLLAYPECFVSYLLPATCCLRKHFCSLQGEADVWRYVAFLRSTVRLGDGLPVDLGKIYQHFRMSEPLQVSCEDSQEISRSSYKGLSLSKEADPIVRQRFTAAHGLIELLFAAQRICR